eukprot:GAHX01000061.1.p1 GENE.GAHX01000061.1~~GAHX01000061.1.p1  ORF type:complete len:427 (-),score=81.65 GAHX01000061.1:1153-2433(-)
MLGVYVMSLEINFLLYNKNFKIKDEEIQWATFKHRTNIENSNGQISKLLGICETTVELSIEIDEHSKVSVLETQEKIIAISSQFKDIRFCLVFKTSSVDMIYKDFKKEFIDKLSRLIFGSFYRFCTKQHEDCELLFDKFVDYLNKVKEFNQENPFSVFKAVIAGVPVVLLAHDTQGKIDSYFQGHFGNFLTNNGISSLKLFHEDSFVYSYQNTMSSKGSKDSNTLSGSSEFSEQEETTMGSSIYNNNLRLDPSFDKVTFLFYFYCLVGSERTIIRANKKKGFIINLQIKDFNWQIMTSIKMTPQDIQQLKNKLDFKLIREIEESNDFISDVVITQKMAAILNVNFYNRYIGDISFKKYLNFIFRKNYFVDSKLEEEIILYNEETKNGLICKYIGTIEKYLVVYIHNVEEEDVKKHWLDSLRILFCA